VIMGDFMANVTQDVKDALELGGIATGFTLTTPDYGEIDATTRDGVKLEVRVVVMGRE